MRSLPAKDREKVLALVALLEEEGSRLGRPFATHLEDRIYEPRVRISTMRYRVLYFFWRLRTIVLTHGFIKRGASVPAGEITRAKRFREAWRAVHGGADR